MDFVDALPIAIAPVLLVLAWIVTAWLEEQTFKAIRRNREKSE